MGIDRRTWLNNDTLDHIVTAILALVLTGGMFVIQLNQGVVPEWAVAALGAVLGFYFRGRVNGQYNASKMGTLEEELRAIKQAAREIKDRS